MMKEIGISRRPVVVHGSLNRHWSTAFVTIELEKPAITLITCIPDSHISLERDFEWWGWLQLVKRTVLGQIQTKQAIRHLKERNNQLRRACVKGAGSDRRDAVEDNGHSFLFSWYFRTTVFPQWLISVNSHVEVRISLVRYCLFDLKRNHIFVFVDIRTLSTTVIKNWHNDKARNFSTQNVSQQFSFLPLSCRYRCRPSDFSRHIGRNFPRLNALTKSTSICFSSQRYPEVDLEFSQWELNQENAIANEAAHLLTKSCKD